MLHEGPWMFNSPTGQQTKTVLPIQDRVRVVRGCSDRAELSACSSATTASSGW